MQANDLITQVHSEEDDNGHHEHLDHDGSAQSQSFWQKFLGCLLCRSKAAPPAAGNKSNIYSKHASVPLQPQNSHVNNANSVNNNSNATPTVAVTTTTTVTKTSQNAPMPSIPLTSPPQPAVQMNGAPPSKYLLPPLSREEVIGNKKTLVLDLDETLVHSSFKPIPNADFVLSIDLEGVIHRVSDAFADTQLSDTSVSYTTLQSTSMAHVCCYPSLSRSVVVIQLCSQAAWCGSFLAVLC